MTSRSSRSCEQCHRHLAIAIIHQPRLLRRHHLLSHFRVNDHAHRRMMVVMMMLVIATALLRMYVLRLLWISNSCSLLKSLGPGLVTVGTQVVIGLTLSA